jgi:hypothetical protein
VFYYHHLLVIDRHDDLDIADIQQLFPSKIDFEVVSSKKNDLKVYKERAHVHIPEESWTISTQSTDGQCTKKQQQWNTQTEA